MGNANLTVHVERGARVKTYDPRTGERGSEWSYDVVVRRGGKNGPIAYVPKTGKSIGAARETAQMVRNDLARENQQRKEAAKLGFALRKSKNPKAREALKKYYTGDDRMSRRIF
jgi:hypothetical protein